MTSTLINSPRKTAEKAEHVAGIVLQPLWKTQKIDWTNRKNVFEKPKGQNIIDEATLKGKHPLFRSEPWKDTTFIFQKEQLDKSKDRPLNPPRYRVPYTRKRWSDNLARKHTAGPQRDHHQTLHDRP